MFLKRIFEIIFKWQNKKFIKKIKFRHTKRLKKLFIIFLCILSLFLIVIYNQSKIINDIENGPTLEDFQGNKNIKNRLFKNKNLDSNINKKIIPGELNLNNYIIKKQIGRGGFGKIFLVEDINYKQYALKIIMAKSERKIKKTKKELKILLDIQNSFSNLNIASIYGITSQQIDSTKYSLYILMELASTDWKEEILERGATNNYYSEYELMSILYSMVKTLSILQRKNISHSDIKPQNILIFKDNSGKKKYKLSDFGNAREILSANFTDRPHSGRTILFMAPILLNALRVRKRMEYIQYNLFKSDVFSFGLCALFAATLDFDSIYNVRQLRNSNYVFYVVEKYLRPNYSDSVINIIFKMLDLEEETRYDFIELEREFNKFGYY